MSYTLCVIDMQDYFTSSRGKRVRRSCIREINKAMRDKATILFVEYSPEHYGTTIPLLTDVVKKAKYYRSYHVAKHSNGGGFEVVEFLKQKHLPRMNLRVCGVNTDYCVKDTVSGINARLKRSNINIVADACDSRSGTTGHKLGLSYMKKLSNVKLIRNRGWV
jgi:nicotinamidase-related amidase